MQSRTACGGKKSETLLSGKHSAQASAWRRSSRRRSRGRTPPSGAMLRRSAPLSPASIRSREFAIQHCGSPKPYRKTRSDAAPLPAASSDGCAPLQPITPSAVHRLRRRLVDERQLVVLEPDPDRPAALQPAEQDLVGQRIPDLGLDDPRQRTRAEDRVVALLRQPRPRGRARARTRRGARRAAPRAAG